MQVHLAAPLAGGVLAPEPLASIVTPTGAGTPVRSGPVPVGVPSGTTAIARLRAPDAGSPACACARTELAPVTP